MNNAAATKIISILLLPLILLYFMNSKRQVYVYDCAKESTNGGFEDFHALAKSDNTISESVDERSLPITPESQLHTHDYMTPKSVDVHSQPVTPEYQFLNSTPKAMPEYSKPMIPESQVLFPYANITRLPHEILNSPWATELKEKLDAAKIGKQITYVTVSMNYFPTLINWMIHAKLNAMPLLENLLVVSTDKNPDEILSQKGILSQYVPITDILYTMENLDKTKIFSARVIVRMTILRLLNYWGYDVLLVDIDAILINNIQPILDHFHDSDIIESTVHSRHCLPRAAYIAWKFCLNIGLFLIRSNAKTGMYHNYTHIFSYVSLLLMGVSPNVIYGCVIKAMAAIKC